MSNPTHENNNSSEDPIESIVHSIPVVIPAAGALLIFLLAFIAVVMT